MILLALLLSMQAGPADRAPDELDQYQDCVQKEAIRLEPSRETPETVVTGAEKLCQYRKFAFTRRMMAEWTPEKSLTRVQYQSVATSRVESAERRANDAAFSAVLEKRLIRNTGK